MNIATSRKARSKVEIAEQKEERRDKVPDPRLRAIPYQRDAL